jgi:hypothetical protein
MATGFPASTGNILTADMFNGLVTFDASGSDQTADYTAVIGDSYQKLVYMNKATAVAFKIPTNASVAYPVGTVLNILNKGAGTVTISAVTSGTTTIVSAGAVSASPTLGTAKMAACVKVALDTWYCVGAIG